MAKRDGSCGFTMGMVDGSFPYFLVVEIEIEIMKVTTLVRVCGVSALSIMEMSKFN
jgi:hypothetical protein